MFKKNKKLTFSIRKFTVGVGSVAIGALLLVGPHASMAEASNFADGVTPTSVSEAASETSYAISGVWNLQNQYPSTNKYISNYETDAYKTAQTDIVREDGSKVTVTASVVDSAGNPEGLSYLVPGGDQSSYGATADMFYKVDDSASIPALGVFTQPAASEGNGNLENKLNFSGKAESSILTLTFSEEVTNPIIDFSGIGGSTSFTYVTETNPYPYGRGSFNSTYFELLTDGVTLEKAGEGVNLTVTSNSIETTKKNNYYRSVLDDDIYSGGAESQMPKPEPAGTGSVILKGTFKTVSFKLYHESKPFTEFSTVEYGTGTDYFANNYPNTRSSVPSDAINGGNKHWSDITNYTDENGNEGVSNDDKLRLSVRIENLKPGSVVVNYVDSEGNAIGTEYKDLTNVAVGTAYDTTVNTGTVDSAATTERPAVITKDGKTYRLVASDKTLPVGQVNADGSLKTDAKGNGLGTDSATGTVEADTTKHVTYVYEEVKGSVNARYVIEGTETEIADDKSVKTDAPVDEAYQDEAPAEITKNGVTYELVRTRTKDGDAPAAGAVKEGTQTITYEYKVKTTEKVDVENKEGKVVVHYVTEDGQTLQADVEDTASTVVETTTTTSQVDSAGNVIGDPVVITEKKDVAYDTAVDNKPAEITVDGKTYVLVGTAVEDTAGNTQLVDGKVVTAETTSEEQGNVVPGTTEITYVYKLKEEPKGRVNAHYVLVNTDTKLAADKVVKTDAPVGEEYSDKAPASIEKDGKRYEFVGTRQNTGDAPAEGTVKEGTQDITYEYTEVPKGSVIVDYVIQGTNTKLQDTYTDTPTAYIRDKEGNAIPYNTAENGTEKPTIIEKDGVKYELVGIKAGSDAEQGTLREGEQHVIYEYRKVEEPVVKQGNVVVTYVSEDGTPISGTTTGLPNKPSVATKEEDTTLSPIDTPYNTTDLKPTTITTADGVVYQFVKTSDTSAPEEGKVAEGTTTVTYVYRRVPVETTEEVKTEVKGNVVVHYVTVDGTVLQSPVEDTPSTVVSTTVTTVKKVDGVVVSSTPVTTPSGAKYDTAVDNKPTEITVNGKTYVLVGTAVEDPNGNTQLVDGKVKTASSTDEEEGDVKEGTTDITYVYKLKEEPKTPDQNTDPGKKQDPKTPVEPSNKDNSQTPSSSEPTGDNKEEPQTTSKRVLPSTGEAQNGLTLAGLGVLLAGFIALARKRRKD